MKTVTPRVRDVLRAEYGGKDTTYARPVLRRNWTTLIGGAENVVSGKIAKAHAGGKVAHRRDLAKIRRGAAATIDAAAERSDHVVERAEVKLTPGLAVFDFSPELVAESVDNFLAVYDVDDAVPRFIEALLPHLPRPVIGRLRKFIATL